MKSKLSVDELEEAIDMMESSKDDVLLATFTKKIIKVVIKVLKKKPSIKHSESTYNYLLVYTCIEAMISMLEKEEESPYFVPGEEELRSMTDQLNKVKKVIDHRKKYKANGVIRLQRMDDLGVLAFETAGPFGKKDERKRAFDDSKRMFAYVKDYRRRVFLYFA